MSFPQVDRQRIVSLDQFRGYTVLGMFLVNFVGGFYACHYLLKHHNTFLSYADTIMPQFLFAVGFAFRLTFARRAASQGVCSAYVRVVKRLLGLMLVALVVYTVGPRAETWNQLVEMGAWEAIKVPLKRDWFQTLMHIAVTSLWILPVIRSGMPTRLAYMVTSALLHVILAHHFYFNWVNTPPNGIDGGPLGFLTWTIPAIVGTLTCDAVVAHEGRPPVFPLIFWAVVLMGLGYVLSCGTRLYDVPAENVQAQAARRLAAEPVLPPPESLLRLHEAVQRGQWRELLAEPPFGPPPHPPGKIDQSFVLRKWNYWMMSQRAGTISYLTFAAGFSLAVYAIFYVVCDLWGWQLGVFRTFGTNALFAYVLHMLVQSAIEPFMPKDSPQWYMWVGCALFLTITYLFVRTLEKNNIYIRL
jgi:predicted acyltransferase